MDKCTFLIYPLFDMNINELDDISYPMFEFLYCKYMNRFKTDYLNKQRYFF